MYIGNPPPPEQVRDLTTDEDYVFVKVCSDGGCLGKDRKGVEVYLLPKTWERWGGRPKPPPPPPMSPSRRKAMQELQELYGKPTPTPVPGSGSTGPR